MKDTQENGTWAAAELRRYSDSKAEHPADHTPGPWTFGEQRSSAIEPTHRQVTAPHADNGPIQKKVATVYYGDAAERLANSRLIAAAPELLAALQQIDANAAESVEWIRRVARAAISKATGGAQ